MGEARRRGTFEQRKAEGIIRQAKEAEERKAAFEARAAERERLRQEKLSKTTDPQERRRISRISTFAIMAASMAIGVNQQ